MMNRIIMDIACLLLCSSRLPVVSFDWLRRFGF
jgi:hypothetical protein